VRWGIKNVVLRERENPVRLSFFLKEKAMVFVLNKEGG